ADQRGHLLWGEAIGERGVRRLEDRADVPSHGHVPVPSPGMHQRATRGFVGAVELTTMDRNTRGIQNLLEPRDAPACVPLVSARAVDQQRAPTVEGDGVNDHRGTTLLLAVITVVALIRAVVAIVLVLAFPAKIHAVQDHSENATLHGLDLL